MQKMSKVISAMSLLQQIGIIDLASSNIQMHISTHTRKFHAILTKCLQKRIQTKIWPTCVCGASHTLL